MNTPYTNDEVLKRKFLLYIKQGHRENIDPESGWFWRH